MISGVTKRENLFFIALISYTMRSFLYDVAIDENAVIQLISKVILITDFALLTIKLLADFSQNLISIEKLRIMILGFAVAIAILIGSKSGGYIFIWILICAAHNISFQKIAAIVSVTMLLSILIVFIGCDIGLLENTKTDGIYDFAIREAQGMGFAHYFDAAHITFNAVVVYLYARREKITWIELLLLSALEVIVYQYTTTKNPFAVGMAAITLCALFKLSPWLRTYKTLYGLIAQWIHPLCASAIIILSARCNLESDTIVKINAFLSGRLALGQSAIKTYGISLFGQKIVWSLGEDGIPYNIVDSSYLCALLDYGIVFFIMLMLMFYFMGRCSKKYRDSYFVILTVAIAIHATFDTGLMEIPGNIIFFVLSYMFCYVDNDKTEDGQHT